MGTQVILTLVYFPGWLLEGFDDSYKSERGRTRIHLHSSSIHFLLIQNLNIFTGCTNLRSLELASKQNQANVISISAQRAERVNTQMQALGSALAEGA